MILIADSGATKTQWVIIDENHVSDPIETSGFNPYFMESRILENILDKDLVPIIRQDKISKVFFYGAGCSTPQKCGIVEDALKEVFPIADCEIEHDLLGAARALFGRKEGIACILGTGSNSCRYDGRDIKENVPSLGYLFGDEGSGAYLGKLFLTDYLRNMLPENIRSAFDSKYGYSLENILDAVYSKPHPNRFLSSFSRFLGEFRQEEYVRELIRRNFRDFMKEQVTKYSRYKELPLGLIGSVGYHYGDIFGEVAKEEGLTVQSIIKNPMEGLVRYHKL